MSRTAVVTGASHGIGLAVAARLADEGCAVVGCSRHPGEAQAALESLGARATGITADVSNEADVDRLFDVAKSRYGSVDILINNAGIYEETDFLDLTADDWNRVISVNLTGSFLCSQRAAKEMINSGIAARSGGRIVNVASSTGILSEARSAHYNASKAGLISLTRSLAIDLGAEGILTNCVAPGWIDTGIDPALEALLPEQKRLLNPLGRTGSPEEVANAVAALCDPRASFVNGAVLCVDGGQVAVSPAPDEPDAAEERRLATTTSRGA